MPNVDIDTHDNFFCVFFSSCILTLWAWARWHGRCVAYILQCLTTLQNIEEERQKQISFALWKCMGDTRIYIVIHRRCARQRKSICLPSSPTHIKIDHKTLFPWRALVMMMILCVYGMWLISVYVYVNYMNTKLMQFWESVASLNVMYLDDFLKI